MKQSKIAIIGAGFVGSTTAYALLLKKIAAEIILIDSNETRCHGEILDLADAAYLNEASSIRTGTITEAGQSDIIIIAAGKAQKPGESRTDLLANNKLVIASICKDMQPINPNALIIMVTNPLDPLTCLAQSLSGLPHKQVFGTGTFLDTLRLRGIVAEKTGAAKNSITLYMIGEHGDSQCAVWSSADIAGLTIDHIPGIKKEDFPAIEQQAKDRAYEIISCKGSTYFGIATSVALMCEAIINNQKLILPLSTYISEHKIYFSMPVVLAKHGIEQVIPISLNNEEQKKLMNSINQIKKYI